MTVWLESEQQRRRFQNMFPRSDRPDIGTRRIASFETIGVLTISPLPPAQITLGHTYNAEYVEDLSFNPWNNVPDQHRPLGVVQRMKRRVYAGSRATRFATNEVNDPFEPGPISPRGPDRAARP